MLPELLSLRELAVIEICVKTTLLDQAVVIALLDDLSIPHYKNDIGFTDC